MVIEGSAVDAVVLGLEGVRVLEARQVDGEVELVIETTADRAWCEACGVRAVSKGRSTVLVRDADAFGRPARLRWVKRRWRCGEAACPAATWTEQHSAVGPRRVLSERARALACRRVGRDGHSVAAVAREYGVGWHTVMRAVVEHGRPLIDDPARTDGVAALGVDETSCAPRGAAVPCGDGRAPPLVRRSEPVEAEGRPIPGSRGRLGAALTT